MWLIKSTPLQTAVLLYFYRATLRLCGMYAVVVCVLLSWVLAEAYFHLSYTLFVISKIGVVLSGTEILHWIHTAKEVNSVRHNSRQSVSSSQSPASNNNLLRTAAASLLPPSEYDRMIHARRRCGFISNYFDRLFSLFVTA